MKPQSQEQNILEIKRLKKEKNVIILAHYYQTGDIQDLADFVGDSLALSQKASSTPARYYTFCRSQIYG
jgi:quinolinate synthase